jgi:phospholipid/cholesterol/gamma-HCH transport system substrate-binding protein
VKSLGAGIRVGILVLIVAILGFFVWKEISERAAGAHGAPYWAKFRDASGLSDKSRVVIAGLTIGEIADKRLEGRYARVTVKVRNGTELWSNAAIYKKSSSLLGEYYLEVDPGTPESVGVDGQPVKNHLLPVGSEIPTVVEATTPDELIKKLGDTMPRVNDALDEVKGLVADTRKLINHQITSIADTVDGELKKDAVVIRDVLQRADDALANINDITSDIKRITNGADRKVNAILDNIAAASKDARQLIADTRGEIDENGEKLKKTLDDVDNAVGKVDGAISSFKSTMDSSSSIAKKIDDDQGTLGRLVNDPTIADNVESITNDAKGFTSTLFGIQTLVGLRTEYNFVGQAWKTYLGVEIETRPDKFYVFELVRDPRGKIERTAFDNNGMLTTAETINEDLRFSIMFGRRFGPLSLRLGIKESTGGAGADYDIGLGSAGKLRLTADLFDTSFDKMPRLKLWAAYSFFKYLYVVGGVDDVLNDFHKIDLVGPGVGGVTGDERKTYSWGRDWFGGVMLTFNDQDLSALLFIAGSAIAGALH